MRAVSAVFSVKYSEEWMRKEEEVSKAKTNKEERKKVDKKRRKEPFFSNISLYSC